MVSSSFTEVCDAGSTATAKAVRHARIKKVKEFKLVAQHRKGSTTIAEDLVGEEVAERLRDYLAKRFRLVVKKPDA